MNLIMIAIMATIFISIAKRRYALIEQPLYVHCLVERGYTGIRNRI